jgi:signal transduction histidine kinase
MRTDQRSIRLVVEDDGKGMGDKEQASGHGLANMRARAERIGARLSMDGTRGTRLHLALALTT